MTEHKERGERIDTLLKRLQIVKSREKAKYACNNGKVFVNGNRVKSSYIVDKGDIVSIILGMEAVEYEIMDIPKVKNIKKSDTVNYYRIVRRYEQD